MSQENDTPQNLFNLFTVREHVVMINEHIKKMELAGKKEVFDFELELMTVFPEFYEKYPFLVKRLCKRSDLTVLYQMLDNLEQVEKGNKSLASVEHTLGDELANKFLYPSLNKKK